MGQRILTSRGALAVLSAAAVAVSLASIHVGAQSTAPKAAAKPAKAWTMPHTPDGQPDLTGDWTYATYTPLERPANFAGQEFFTPEEAAAFAKRAIDQFNGQAKDNIHYDDAIWQTENYNKGLSSLRTCLPKSLGPTICTPLRLTTALVTRLNVSSDSSLSLSSAPLSSVSRDPPLSMWSV